jgi:hypothetical protein
VGGNTAGLVLGLPPVLSGVAATSGGLLGAVLVSIAGERLQRWLYSQRFFSKRRQRVERLWNRYGLIGVAFQSPVFAGTLLSTLVALGLGAPAENAAVLDKREFNILGRGAHRSGGSWLLHIRELASFGRRSSFRARGEQGVAVIGLHYESQCGCGSSQHTSTNREACYQRLAKTYTSCTD